MKVFKELNRRAAADKLLRDKMMNMMNINVDLLQ